MSAVVSRTKTWSGQWVGPRGGLWKLADIQVKHANGEIHEVTETWELVKPPAATHTAPPISVARWSNAPHLMLEVPEGSPSHGPLQPVTSHAPLQPVTKKPSKSKPEKIAKKPAAAMKEPAKIVKKPAAAMKKPAKIVKKPAAAMEKPATK